MMEDTIQEQLLSIAGFDPCGGAGVLADAKVFQRMDYLGFAVNTCITYQNESEFHGLEWLEWEQIQKQLDTLKYNFKYVKIGLVKDLEQLLNILNYIREKNEKAVIVWDPVLKSSSGFVFNDKVSKERLRMVLRRVDIITPNLNEIKVLDEKEPYSAAKYLSKYCNVILKGGHSNNHEFATDWLFVDGEEFEVEGKRIPKAEKHGSGCVYSSSLLAELANGYEVVEAMKKTKELMKTFLSSSEGLLGYV